MKATGIVVRGRGKGTDRIAAIATDLALVLGGSPAPGTLNVTLSTPLEFDPTKAVLNIDGKRLFWPIKLNGLFCLAYRWRSCPLHIVEVVSTRHLRSELGLVNGSKIEIEAPHGRRAPLMFFLAWAAFWAFRQQYYYSSDAYIAWTKRYPKIRTWAGQRVSA